MRVTQCLLIFHIFTNIINKSTLAYPRQLPPTLPRSQLSVTISRKEELIEMKEIIEKATNWVSMDPNPHTSSYMQNLIKESETHGESQNRAQSELQSLFSKRIDFGTAGLRSKMFPGPANMNDLIIIQTTQGLARYCQLVHNKNDLTAVVGYDHRANYFFNLSSHRFALYTRQVFLKAGFSKVVLLCLSSGYVATPLVSFATIELNAACGVMITASHNPREDDGYKVYWKDGCQIRSPIDKGIKESILTSENLQPWDPYIIEDVGHQEGLAETVRLSNLYFKKMKDTGLITGKGRQAVLKAQQDNIPIPKIAYTAMHGVGYPWAKRSFEEFGLPPFSSVPTQQNPDPIFPTVSFPNPEEKGALNLAMEFSEKNHLNVILANDPDADRLAVAERHIDENTRETREWVTFTGDQIGVMLGHWIYEQVGKGCGQPVAMCASTVSSSMLSKIAQMEKFYFEDTLTGFKWIGAKVLSLREQTPKLSHQTQSCFSPDMDEKNFRVLFAYEEAIGFCCGEVVPDKDGVSAVSVFAELVYHVYIEKQQTLSQHMQSLYDKYGEFVSHNGYYFYKDASVIPEIFDHIRNDGKYHSQIQQYKISSIRDLGVPGYDSTTPDHKPILPVSGSSPMITIKFENGCVAQFRASGTEPKFKYYIEMAGKVGKSRAEVQKELEVMAETILNDLVRPKELGLIG